MKEDLYIVFYRVYGLNGLVGLYEHQQSPQKLWVEFPINQPYP